MRRSSLRMLRTALLGLWAVSGVSGVTGCSRAEPPTPDASPFVARAPASALDPAGALPADAAPAAAASLSTPPSSRVAAPAPAPVGSAEATAGSAALGQTQEMPSAEAASFRAHAALLWRAIVDDNADTAMSFFFPLAAYQQVKDVGDPAADWNHRLVAAFRHDIHALHAKLGADATSATFVSLDVPSGHARWVLPGEEWNKIGYYRVFGTKLRYEASGETRSFDVKSLISWRGEWYVVHLSAIR